MSDDRFVRWQGYTISQFTFAINFFLGLAIGALAFSMTLLKAESFILGGCLKLFFSIGFFALCLSVLAGCAAVVMRLMDFRLTTKRIREQFKGGRDDELGIYRFKTKLLGRVSWHLFWLELATLIVGLIGLVRTIVAKYGIKLL